MKRSTWPCRKSRFIRPAAPPPAPAFRPRRRHDLPLAPALLALLAASGCQLSRAPKMDNVPPSASARVPAAVLPPLSLADPQVPKLRLRAPGAAQPVLAEVGVVDCAVPAPLRELRLRTMLASDFGNEPLAMSIRGDGAAETVRAEVETYRMSFAAGAQVKGPLAERVCAAIRAGTPEVTAEPAEANAVNEWMQLVAPDCNQLKPGATGWTCRLPQIEPEAARQELTGIQITMIRRWSRQPYVLARRLAVGVSLAQALAGRDVEKQLDTFCNIVLNSLAVELPVTLASRRWQDSVCAKPAPHRIDAARFGLAKTVAEIDFMRQLFERTSRLGTLSLRIPAVSAPGLDVLISLTPLADVAENLTRETAKLWLADAGGAATQQVTPEEMPRSCWHPVFGEDSGLLKLARQLAMAGDAARITCEDTESPRSKTFAPDRYFAESITSETQFVLPNGRSKTLRLPAGRYSYTLRPLPADPEDWDDASQLLPHTTGEIAWDAHRPRPVISIW